MVMNIEKMVKDLQEHFTTTLFAIETTKEKLRIYHNNEYFGLYAEIDERVDFMSKVIDICRSSIDGDIKVNICISFSDELPNLTTMVS